MLKRQSKFRIARLQSIDDEWLYYHQIDEMRYRKITLFLVALAAVAQAQVDTTLLSTLSYRFVGPSRGGRCTAVAGIPAKPFSFYMGSTGGGVWRTDDAGTTWKPISDGQIKCGGIGSIAVAASAPRVVYVGTGSDSPRGNISPGIGMYKSIDEGDTWSHVGLDKCGQIGDILVHPKDANTVYAAALGNVFKPNKERGVFKSIDGGVNWEHVFFLSDSVGAVDIEMDPTNPDIIYAGMWRAERKPWTMIDGGTKGGLYKSIDAGKTWNKIENGLPTGIIGKIGLAISPVDPKRIWVIQQAAEEKMGGVYRSDDGGKSFKRINRHHKLRQRGWYYSRIFADPKNENTVYVTNTGFYKSIDGGKTFDTRFRVPHGDNHDVWINPENPQILINSNDGGANVSLNGGKTWSAQTNQPTPEFYRVSVDNQWPYNLYAGQQDNSAIGIPSRSARGLDPKQSWKYVGGGESADVAVDPSDPDVVYATTYSGIITRVNQKTGERRDIGAYPHYTEGTETRQLKYRWQWNFPIRVSQHDPKVIYHTSNFVHRSTDEGQSWEVISPDLTRDIDAYHEIPGGPVQHDGTGVEIYSTIFSFEESPHDGNTLWAGSDDGRIHISRDAGKTWTEITPQGKIPKEATINNIRPSTHAPGRAFVAAMHYRMGDFHPYILKTDDFGASWELISKDRGIPADHFVRCVAEDPDRKDLLYAGTEFGMYFSPDGGASWQSLQQDLPHTPVTDMEVHQGDLILSTQGRGFWIMDDLSVLHQLDKPVDEVFLFEPEATYRSNLSRFPYRGQIHFLNRTLDTAASTQISIYDANDQLVQQWSTEKKDGANKLKMKKGMNMIKWDLRHQKPTLVKDLVMMDMSYPGVGPRVAPGSYRILLEQGDEMQTSCIVVKRDPRWDVTDSDLQANQDLALQVRNLITQSQEELLDLRSVNEQIASVLKHGEDVLTPELSQALKDVKKENKDLQDMIYQDQIETSQDEINFRRKFTNHIIRLYRVIISQNDRPTAGELERWEDVQNEYEPFAEGYLQFVNEKLPELIKQLQAEKMPLIITKPSKP